MHDIAPLPDASTPMLERDAPDNVLLDTVQRRTFGYFWELAHPVSGAALDRAGEHDQGELAPISTGGTGTGVMAIIVAAERGWCERHAARQRIARIVGFLESAESFRGMFPHYLDGATGDEFTFWPDNAGGDVQETALLIAGLLCARQYFSDSAEEETSLRRRIDRIWRRVDWSWYTGGENALIWHWGFKHGWASRHRIVGWDECLISYVLAAASPTFPIGAAAYHEGWTSGRTFRNGGEFHGHRLPLGPDYGGSLFYAHLPFLGLDPRGLKDRYADYLEQVTNHTLINYEHAVRNPNGFAGYGPDCWGLTASDGNEGYAAHAPDLDRGVIAPAAALCSLPYTPELSMRALRHFYFDLGDRIWRKYGFVDAFNLGADWYDTQYLAISQGPIVVMLENYRSGLIWRLFMSCPEVQHGLDVLGFEPRPSV
jgi:hypothetical protein